MTLIALEVTLESQRTSIPAQSSALPLDLSYDQPGLGIVDASSCIQQVSRKASIREGAVRIKEVHITLKEEGPSLRGDDGACRQ